MPPWHPHHIAERYGVFVLIVLGESVASAAADVPRALHRDHDTAAPYLLAAGGLLLVLALWWLYFARPAHPLLATSHQARRRSFTWAYGHCLILVSAAAEGAGLAARTGGAGSNSLRSPRWRWQF